MTHQGLPPFDFPHVAAFVAVVCRDPSLEPEHPAFLVDPARQSKPRSKPARNSIGNQTWTRIRARNMVDSHS